MNLEHLNELKKLLSSSKKIAIIPHKNPDGDAIGSTLALWHYLVNSGHTASIVSPNDFPKFLKWMPGADKILNFEKENIQSKSCIEKADIVFTLDFNHLGRVGHMSETLESANATFVMVDHHQEPSDYAKIMYSDVSMSSTCEMVYVLIKKLGNE
ncbi:DHH family phosphoesterase, partial [Maribacter arcticus]